MERAFPGVDVLDVKGGFISEPGPAAPAGPLVHDPKELSGMKLRQAEMLEMVSAQSASISEFDLRLGAIESMLAELVAAHRDKRSQTLPSMKRSQSTKKLSRSQSSKLAVGRSGTKGKPESVQSSSRSEIVWGES